MHDLMLCSIRAEIRCRQVRCVSGVSISSPRACSVADDLAIALCTGHIDSKEFQQLCFALGYALTPVEIEVAIKVLDTDGSGKVGE